jgi:ribosomal peptide maturation radical SAM protein 1
MTDVDVCLVNMPYGGIDRPSIGLGLLKAALRRFDISSEIIYANLKFAETVGVVRYSIPDRWTAVEHFAGEWSFAKAAFCLDTPDDEYFQGLDQLLRGRLGADDSARNRGLIYSGIRDLSRFGGPFIDQMATSVLERKPRIVGCTSMFQQHCASLALLRRIRELDPSVVTVLGGPNCESEMGAATHRNCEWVDFVVSGEADSLVGPLFRSILESGREVPQTAVPDGVLAPADRNMPGGSFGNSDKMATNIVPKLDDLPAPDYDDYFSSLRDSVLRDCIHPVLLIETSRGCWWGQKKHCTFCGLNANGMAFRLKSADRVLSELGYLTERHGVNHIEAVDNILSMTYFETLIPALASRESNWRLFYETKSNLRRNQVEAMRRAGITFIQPGIESLHSEVLSLMRKGVRAVQNVRLLKWARQSGIRVVWSILRGFPGEKDDWYRKTAAWIPQLEHFDPPSGIFPVRYDRFSPFHKDSDVFGLRLEPAPLIRFIYPFSERDLADQTYYFVDKNPSEGPDKGPGTRAVENAIGAWMGTFIQGNHPALWYEERDDSLEFHDTRSCAESDLLKIDGLLRYVYLLTEDGISRNRLIGEMESRKFPGTGDDADGALAFLVNKKLVLEVDGQFLGLATKGPPPSHAALEDAPLGYIDPTYYHRELTTLINGTS